MLGKIQWFDIFNERLKRQLQEMQKLFSHNGARAARVPGLVVVQAVGITPVKSNATLAPWKAWHA